MTRLLPNPEFLKWLLAAIRKAKKRIVVVNYLAAIEHDRRGSAVRVAKALVAAARRGVKVEVVLEGSKFRENMAFYRFLRDAGADVWMDTSLTFIHTKAVLLDDRTLLVGSHNITSPALVSHHELSAAFTGRKPVRDFKKELERMTEQRQRIGGDVCRTGASLSLSMITPREGSKGVAPLVALKRAKAPQAYMLYLLLLRLDGGSPKRLAVDAKGWISDLGLAASTASASVRVETMLSLMDEKLGLVRFDSKRGMVKRLLPPLCKGRAGRGRSEKGELILLPDTFWKYGWHRRLSVDAIHLYLAGEAERLASPYAPWWRLKRDEIASRYGFQKQLVNRAQEELRRAGLLEVIYEVGSAPAGKYARQMNYFRQNPFHDPETRERAIAKVKRRYKKPVFDMALKIATDLMEESDAEKLGALCSLIRNAGPKASRAALARLKGLAPNTTLRTFAYAAELLA